VQIYPHKDHSLMMDDDYHLNQMKKQS